MADLCSHCLETEAALAERDREIERLRDVLLRKGYRETCDIPACNCGDQWNHGGHAETRLHEIADELRELTQGSTVLGAVKRLRSREAKWRELREAEDELHGHYEVGGLDEHQVEVMETRASQLRRELGLDGEKKA